jgi:hypothetical protein
MRSLSNLPTLNFARPATRPVAEVVVTFPDADSGANVDGNDRSETPPMAAPVEGIITTGGNLQITGPTIPREPRLNDWQRFGRMMADEGVGPLGGLQVGNDMAGRFAERESERVHREHQLVFDYSVS